MIATIVIVVSVIIAGVLGFVVGWNLRGTRASVDRATWSYATCASFIGLRLCLDRHDESLRKVMTEQARMHYGSWRAGRRRNPPPLSPSTDELFRIADGEFAD